jgi:hypothetical protein
MGQLLDGLATLIVTLLFACCTVAGIGIIAVILVGINQCPQCGG